MAIAQRYEAILDSAADVFGRRGYHPATIREIARAAGLSLAGLYHYVGGKEEVLFLVLDRTLDALITALDRALRAAPEPEAKLRALVQTHLEFTFRHPQAMKVVNRDWEQVAGPRRAEIALKRQAYLTRGLAVLRALDPHARAGDELLSAITLLVGMLNGIARPPFVRSADDAQGLAHQVGALFLHGFLERPGGAAHAAALHGGDHAR
ncbi:MAG: TetR family transcriptional regulator [Candidatus Rokubacteria bacterium]|nr:TetR family transcriptional regulator [Candidatus Rokubacteria bacterium]